MSDNPLRRPFSRRDLLSLLALSGLTLVVPSLTGCGGGGDDNGTSNPSTEGEQVPRRVVTQPGWTTKSEIGVQKSRTWTILLYMNGANDLEEFGSLNLNQMEQIGSDSNINIVAQFKRYANRYDTSNGDWKGARRYFVQKDSNSSEVTSRFLAENLTLDAGDVDSLKAFIAWGRETFPADKYAIFLWNHGAGWRKQSINSKTVTRGFSYDDETDNHIDTIQLPAGLEVGSKWDLVAWDSSLMQMVEVAYEIRNQAKWIVGSEESPPGTGYPYNLFLTRLAANPGMDGKALGIAVSEEMLNSYGTSSDVTQSVLDPSKIAAVTSAVNALGLALMNAKADYGTEIANARSDAESYGGSDYVSNKDLLDFLRLIKANVPAAAVQAAVVQAEAAVRAAIVQNNAGSQHSNSRGIALYVPTPLTYRRDDIEQANGFGQRYIELAFANDAPQWQNFLANGPS